MTVTIELKPEAESTLAAQARARGVSLERHLGDLIEEIAGASAQPMAPEQREQAFEEWMLLDIFHPFLPCRHRRTVRAELNREGGAEREPTGRTPQTQLRITLQQLHTNTQYRRMSRAARCGEADKPTPRAERTRAQTYTLSTSPR